jgi:hypothetical protein
MLDELEALDTVNVLPGSAAELPEVINLEVSIVLPAGIVNLTVALLGAPAKASSTSYFAQFPKRVS